MAARRRSAVSFAPTCLVFESRLAPSGNFLSHGLAAVEREAKDLTHAHHAEHGTTNYPTTAGEGMKVHYHHINATAAAK